MADDIQKLLEDHKDEIKRYFKVEAESLHDDIKGLGEGVEGNTQRLERLQGLPDTIEAVRDDSMPVKA